MRNERLYRKLAKLAVCRGVNVQPGQKMILRGSVKDYEFLRICAEEAYLRGAGSVEMEYMDDEITRMHYTYQTEESLAEVPDWVHDREIYRHGKGACYLGILSEAPGNLKDVDPAKMNAAMRAYSAKMKDTRAYTMNNIGQWSVTGIASPDWAKAVFPDLPEEKAFGRLEELLFYVTRVSEDNDPVQEWQEHDEELIRHAEILTKEQFKALHFTSELGTDITVELVKDHIRMGGGVTTPKGVYFDPNMPTEEIFCMPLKTGVNGIVYASKPLAYNGKLIEGFWLRFENGKAVEFGAEKEEETLKNLLEMDEGSCYLGEVALVPYDSPISQSGILFFNTLYDENAACHLALGNPYAENLKGGTEMSEEELAEHGANSSIVHEDFMFGTKEMSIDGIREDGTIVPVFRHGNFVF